MRFLSAKFWQYLCWRLQFLCDFEKIIFSFPSRIPFSILLYLLKFADLSNLFSYLFNVIICAPTYIFIISPDYKHLGTEELSVTWTYLIYPVNLYKQVSFSFSFKVLYFLNLIVKYFHTMSFCFSFYYSR